jgi:hypothetical protein
MRPWAVALVRLTAGVGRETQERTFTIPSNRSCGHRVHKRTRVAKGGEDAELSRLSLRSSFIAHHDIRQLVFTSLKTDRSGCRFVESCRADRPSGIADVGFMCLGQHGSSAFRQTAL